MTYSNCEGLSLLMPSMAFGIAGMAGIIENIMLVMAEISVSSTESCPFYVARELSGYLVPLI